jgi:hypothetical protein
MGQDRSSGAPGGDSAEGTGLGPGSNPLGGLPREEKKQLSRAKMKNYVIKFFIIIILLLFLI